jgi:hypothetical protein
MASGTEGWEDRVAIVEALDAYAEALDSRRWEQLERIFAPDVEFDFGEWCVTGRDEVAATIQQYLGGCGPTQHLLGNYRVQLDGDTATSAVYVRAFHIGVGETAGLTYEMCGEYRDEFRRGRDGWRSLRRKGRVFLEVGSREVLRPAS